MQKRIRFTIFKIILILSVILLGVVLWKYIIAGHAHSKLPKTSDSSILTLEKKTTVTTLYFSGIAKPLSTIPVPSPVDGVIKKRGFDFGDHVTKGQLLYMLSSKNEHAALQAALSAYLTAKHNLDRDKIQLEQTEMLYRKGLESKNNYQTIQDTFFTDQLALLQAEAQIRAIKFLPFEQIAHLAPKNMSEIHETFELRNAADDIRIYSPSDGIALFVKSNDHNTSNNDFPSNHVKEGDILTAIGDTNGLTFSIKIDELNFSQIRLHQKATVTLPAVQDFQLTGYVSHINAQASSDSDNNIIPSFSAMVTVPQLTANQQALIHIGMSAKIAIEVQHTPQIVIPLKALMHHQNQTYVSVINPKTKKITPRSVTPGDTQIDSIIILNGLSAGETILVPH